MKGLYVLAALMLVGVLLMFFTSYKILNELDSAKQEAKGKQVALRPQVQPLVTVSYLGVTLFLVGAVGAIFVVFREMNRRM